MTIDRITHALRRWLWRLLCLEPAEDQCIDCGRELTREEEYYYCCNCERCEALLQLEDR